MGNAILRDYIIDYVEIYTPMAKCLAYLHTSALGFENYAFHEELGRTSYVLKSKDVTLVLTSSYPTRKSDNDEVSSFIIQNYFGVKRFALRVPDVTKVFEVCISNGAFPIKFPNKTEDENGFIEEASIKLYEHCEVTFINRDNFHGPFKPNFKEPAQNQNEGTDFSFLTSIDHIASELRINESKYWSEYLVKVLGLTTVQEFERGIDNKTGMILNVNQSHDSNLTLVIAEPSSYNQKSKVQNNVETFGPGIHHLAFLTDDISKTVRFLKEKNIEFVKFPDTYYNLLRENKDFESIDIDALQEAGILIDKEGETFLLQKFLKPFGDRPFFFYEIVQRVNGYNGFALKNINILKKAEEMDIMK